MEIDYESLFKWIEDLPITRQKRNIHRDFSDAVPLAEILKHFYPKIVELHNYTPRNAYAQKVVNWETLNRRVLSKLNLGITKEYIEQLASCVPGAIEKLLVDVKNKVEEQADGDIPSCQNVYVFEDLIKDPAQEIVPIKVKSGNKVTDQKIVPAHIYDNMKSELEKKDEQIQVLTAKVEHFENLIQIKETRITDLTKQLENVMNQPNGSSKTSFFERIFS